MPRNINEKIKSIKNAFQPKYLKMLESPIDDKLVLVEGGQGTNINGNMFSMLREIKTNPRWSDYKCVFVVTNKTKAKAKARMQFYGFDDVILSVRDSEAYCKYLATAKYLMTDNSFPPYFYKRDEQVFLNTWHGTPLKTLGKSDKSNLASLANIQKNYLMSDYALFPNEFTRDVFMNDYDLKNIFTGESLIANYPRNYVFYDTEQAVEMKTKLGYDSKQVFAYMPTWRGTGRVANTKLQIKEITKILREFDKKLGDNQVLLVNLHFLLASGVDCDEFEHIDYFPSEYDTYEVLNACDGLVTDYSSVFFDYAVTNKKVILYAYDKEKYLRTRGCYMPFEDLPFPIVETVDDVISEMSVPAQPNKEFLDKFCTNGYKDSCEKLFELMVEGKTDRFTLDKQPNANKDICLIFDGTLPYSHHDSLKQFIKDNPEYNHVIVYRKNFTPVSKEFVLSLDDNVSTLGMLNAFQFNYLEFICFILLRVFALKRFGKITKNMFKREAHRMFFNIKPKKIVDFSCSNTFVSGLLCELDGEKEYVTHGDYFAIGSRLENNRKHIIKLESKNGFSEFDYSATENQIYADNCADDEFAHNSYDRNSKLKNICPIYSKRNGVMRCISFFKLKTPAPIRLNDTYIGINDLQIKPKYFANKSKLSRKHFGIYCYKLPITDVVDFPANNSVNICYKNRFDKLVRGKILYRAIPLNIFLGLRGPITIDKQTDTVAIFRQNRNNSLIIYVRSYIKSDDLIERFRQDLAFVFSLFWRGEKANKLVLLYEKNSSKYEESASVLFEELINSGYKYAYFIVDRNYEFIDTIPEKYRNNIIYKHTFKHYLYFFKSKTFIGTEQPVHAIDLKTFNIFALRKISSKNINYVFLQHGVMYMVSLNSESRKMFKRKELNGKYRVVVSSQAEADHFTELGKHLEEDLYITGLPKFDRNTLNSDADKIIIMPTWRPWEINMARDSFIDTPYFQMVMRIYNSVPDDLKDNVIILPHPLIVNELKHLPESVASKMVVEAKYDDILKQARVLITDYSSIAFDAFYRGTRVIFYWEEKDYCMEQYGPSTQLMLNEENVYGDFFYNTDGLTEAIKVNYDNEQTEYYKSQYSKLVQYHDGKNTQRLIAALKKDKII